MIRKWMTVLLALLLAAALPLTALADMQHTLSVIPGDLLASEEAVADLLEVLDLRLTEGEKSGALTVLLNDQEIVTLGLTADTTGLYAASGLLGADVLYVTWDDGFALLNELMASSLEQNGMDEEMLQGMETALEEAKNGLIAAIAAGEMKPVEPAAPAALEDSLQMVEAMFPDDPAMVEYVKGLYSEMTIEDGSFVDENRDAADQKYRMVMDENDLIAVCETNYMKNTVREAVALEMPEASEEELSKAVEETIAEVKKLYEESGFEMVMEMYTVDAGQALVGLDMTMKMSMQAEGHSADMQMNAEYDRLTDDKGISHQAEGALTADNVPLQFAFDLYEANDGQTSALFGLLADGEEVVVTYGAENTSPDNRRQKADVYMRSGAAAILEPSASDRPIIGFEIITEPAPAETLAALEKANAENSTNVLAMTETEMTALGEQIAANAMQVLYTALGQLPTSTLNLLMAE